MIKLKSLFCFLIVMGVAVQSFAQKTTDKTGMVNERAQIQREMREIQAALETVKGQTKENLAQLAALNKKIELQEKYINNIGREIHLLDDDIYFSAIEIKRLKGQLDTLKAHYARTIVYSYKNRSNYDYLNFIFSANSFNDAIKRVAYLKSYRDYRQKQMGDIVKTSNLIAKRYDLQLKHKQNKKVALDSRSQEYTTLESQKSEKDSVVSLLKSQAGDLQKQFAKKQQQDKELNSSIKAVIRKELAEAQRLAREDAKRKAVADAKARADALARQQAEAERKALAEAKARDLSKPPPATTTTTPEATKEVAAVKPTNLPKSTKVNSGPTLNTKTVPGNNNALIARTNPIAGAKSAPPPEPAPALAVSNKAPEGGYLNYTPADMSLNSNFALNRGRLPSPVEGVITLGFGRYKIEGMGPDIVGDNPGVTYSAPVGSTVKAVFEGDVASVSSVGGMSFVVLRHGKYFTAYSNLSSVAVSKGSKVSRGQAIGRVGADEETGNGKLDFLLMIEDRNVDPRGWLGR